MGKTRVSGIWIVVACALVTVSCGDNAARELPNPVAVPTDDPPSTTATAPQKPTSDKSVAAVPHVAPASYSPLISESARVSFGKLVGSMPGISGIAVSPLGRAQEVSALGSANTAVAWSTSKVPIAMAVIRLGATPADLANIRSAITASDNGAANQLWRRLGSGAQAATAANVSLRAAGDIHTTIQERALRPGFSAFGQTEWSLSDQAAFVAGMPCLPEGRTVLQTMTMVVPGQRWGLGTFGPSTSLKGGWGPGVAPGQASGYIDRQMGVVTIAGRKLAVSMLSVPADGTHETGQRNLTRMAEWLGKNVDVSSLPPQTSCASSGID